MKTMLFAAAAMLSIGFAYAEDSPGPARPPAAETERGAKVPATTPFQVIPPKGSPTYFFSTRPPHNQGTWLFPPHEDSGSN